MPGLKAPPLRCKKPWNAEDPTRARATKARETFTWATLPTTSPLGVGLKAVGALFWEPSVSLGREGAVVGTKQLNRRTGSLPLL